VEHIMVVPDGPLASLPMGLLIAAPAPVDRQGGAYARAEWLAKKYAFSTLPSEASLRALRVFAKRAAGVDPFQGFGDPVLEGQGSARGAAQLAKMMPRGGVADVTEVRKLAPLPETALELGAFARLLGASAQSVHTGAAATEANVKRMDLSRSRVVAFATHGLVAGDFGNLLEPALALTPPAKGSELDDGLLTASEIAQLRLNADWVILSACNTAASDGSPGGEGLSGLAKAFFYAGSRTLVVSHWPVASGPTVLLTTRMFRESVAPGVGKAEALRRSMLALINDAQHPELAHPIFWAPFVIVGEGGAAK
jgi:CHAT domain-containing protein